MNDEQSVNILFSNLINGIKNNLKEKTIGGEVRKAHQSPVDIELTLNELNIKRGGFIVTKRENKQSLSIRLATRIVPEDFD